MSASELLILAGGGTGGHLFPGIAVAEAWQTESADATCLFLGSEREIEQQILMEAGLVHHPLPVESTRTLHRHPLRFLRRLRQSTREAAQLLRDHRPTAVIGLGGFASVPVVRAASRLRIPILLLEQNTRPGRATRWLAGKAAAVCCSFSEAEHKLPKQTVTHTTGNPVRQSVLDIAAKPLNQPVAPQTLLVLGGSQGAVPVNQTVMHALPKLQHLLQGWEVHHQSGPLQVDEVREFYRSRAIPGDIAAFFSDLPHRYRRATVVISRAGATTLAELSCSGLPAVLIPYPQALDDHQSHNAAVYAREGAAVVVPQSDSTADTAAGLIAALRPLLESSTKRNSMRKAMRSLACPDATKEVLRILHSIRTR